MKFAIPPALLVCLLLISRPVHAQTITEVGITSGSQMPGSANDYVIFNNSDWSGGTSNASPYSNLSSFFIGGGVTSDNNDGGTITTPGGTSGVAVGDISAFTQNVSGGPRTLAVAIDSTNNPNFNYNDFNVYLMYSSTTPASQSDTGLLLESSDAYISNPSGVGNFTSVTDNNTDPNSAYFIEFNVQGYAAELAAQPNGFGLALMATTAAGDFRPAYVNGVSFESVPEPSTWALISLGGLVLAWRLRRGRLTA